MPIDLTNPLNLPTHFVKRLLQIRGDCERLDWFEDLLELRFVRHLAEDINAYCMERKVIGIHYTRAIRSEIDSKGLLIRSGKGIRDTFLAEHGNKFTYPEIISLQKAWNDYFGGRQSLSRDKRIFFNFTEQALNGGGAEKLIGLYGGEQVAMPFSFADPVGKKLASIGEPLLIRASLDPLILQTYMPYPWGSILVSAYHTSINSNAITVDQDGYQSEPVLPTDLLEIRKLDNPSV